MGESPRSLGPWLPVATHLFCELAAAAVAKNSFLLLLLHLLIPSQNAAHARLFIPSVHFYHVGSQLAGSQSPARAANERASEANTQEHVKEAASNGLSVTAGCCGPCLPLLTTSNLDKPEDGWMRLDDDRMNGHCDCTAGVECESHSSSPVFGAWPPSPVESVHHQIVG